MWFWLILMLLVLGVFVLAFIYLVKAASKTHLVRFIAGLLFKSRDKYKTVAFILLAIVFVVFVACINVTNAIIVYLHLLIFWMLGDLIYTVIHKINHKEEKGYFVGIWVVAFTIVYLSIGAYLDYNVWETDYSLTSEKAVGDMRIALLADSHVGTTFDYIGFEKRLRKIQAVNPDIVILAGDFVDDDSIKEDMEQCCRILGELKTKYGVYYVFGNHDKGYYNNREYTAEDIIYNMKENGVHILEDESVLIDNRFYVVGRKDKSEDLRENKRADMDMLMEGIDPSKYIIVVDHQPADYKKQSESIADLVVSGHTHGGQLFPINHVGEWIGQNDLVYGHKRIDNTNFIVTSGISDWTIKFKTGCKSEFVVIDVSGSTD